jgi:hypothetical protein
MATKKKSKKPSPKKSTPKLKRKPRQVELPGMENRGIRELEDKANQLDDAQTQKKEYAALSATLNDELVDLMVKHGKTEYHHKSVHIVIPPAKQKAKVTIGEMPETPETEQDDEPSPALRETAEVVYAEA